MTDELHPLGVKLAGQILSLMFGLAAEAAQAEDADLARAARSRIRLAKVDLGTQDETVRRFLGAWIGAESASAFRWQADHPILASMLIDRQFVVVADEEQAAVGRAVKATLTDGRAQLDEVVKSALAAIEAAETAEEATAEPG